VFHDLGNSSASKGWSISNHLSRGRRVCFIFLRCDIWRT